MSEQSSEYVDLCGPCLTSLGGANGWAGTVEAWSWVYRCPNGPRDLVSLREMLVAMGVWVMTNHPTVENTEGTTEEDIGRACACCRRVVMHPYSVPNEHRGDWARYLDGVIDPTPWGSILLQGAAMERDMLLDGAYREGYEAGHGGVPIDTCPHYPGSDEHAEWLEAWRTGHNDAWLTDAERRRTESAMMAEYRDSRSVRYIPQGDQG